MCAWLILSSYPLQGANCWLLTLCPSAAGYLDFVGLSDNLSAPLLSLSSLLSDNNDVNNVQVVVIGQGNVALDYASILAKGGSGLWETDLTAHTLFMAQSGVWLTMVFGQQGQV